MSELTVYIRIYIASVFISSVSQIMLKASAQKKYESRLREYLNPLVIAAYVLFFVCTFITMYALKVVPLSMSPVLEASGYIFVAVLSRFFLNERVSRKKALGLGVIVAGILIYAL